MDKKSLLRYKIFQIIEEYNNISGHQSFNKIFKIKISSYDSKSISVREYYKTHNKYITDAYFQEGVSSYDKKIYELISLYISRYNTKVIENE